MTELNTKAILLMKFTETELNDALQFDCGDNETNAFLRDECFSEQERGLNTTTLVYHNGILAAFISMCCDSIPLNTGEDEKGSPNISVPAIKLRYGIDKQFKDLDLDSFIIDYAKNVAYELRCSHVGVRFLTLDAPSAKEEFFAGKGFVRNISDQSGDLVSMRLDIFEC